MAAFKEALMSGQPASGLTIRQESLAAEAVRRAGCKSADERNAVLTLSEVMNSLRSGEHSHIAANFQSRSRIFGFKIPAMRSFLSASVLTTSDRRAMA